MDNDVLVASHMAEIEARNAEVYNLGWATGTDFIHSKTSAGRLYSEVDGMGNIAHEWQELQTCVLCHEHFYGYGNNPAPLAEQGIACDNCNSTKVIPARIAQLRS